MSRWLSVCLSVRPSVVRPSVLPYFRFWMITIPLPLGVWEGLRFVIVALPGLLSYLFFFFFFFFFFLSKCIDGFSPNLVCASILWRSALGLLMGKFRQFLTGLSAHDTSVFWFQKITSVNINGFSRNLVCALILWGSGLGFRIYLCSFIKSNNNNNETAYAFLWSSISIYLQYR